MTRVDSPWQLPDRTIDEADRADREVRISDFSLMAVIPLRSVEVAGLPVNEFAMAALVGLALFRPARGGARLPTPAVLMMGALMALLVYSNIANGGDGTRRLGHLVIMGGLIWAGGTGRLSRRSVGWGLAFGLVTVIALAAAGVGGDAYAGRLTGYLADPNAGAFFIAVLGVVAIFFCDDRWKVQLVVAVPIVTGLILCLSRTGLLAAVFALAWMTLGRRMGNAAGAAMAVGLVWIADLIPRFLVTFGPFSDRTGSDKLRERIIAQEHVELADMPWYGHGPGSGTVTVRGSDFFFHNSYLATRQEGGWVALVLVLGLMAFAFLRLAHQSRAGDLRAAAAQAAILATAAMGITLGEVLLDIPAAVAVALALGQRIQSPGDRPPDG